MSSLSTYLHEIGGLIPANTKLNSALLNEGFSNKVYLLSWEGIDQLVLRISDIDTDTFYINRKEEMNALIHASRRSLSPNVVWSDGLGNFACEFLSQPTLGWDVCHQERALKTIAETLQNIHKLPKGNHEYFVLQVIEHYLEQILSRISDHSELQKEYNYLLNCFLSLQEPKALLPYVLCHNDLNPKNILMDEKEIWVIDWEYTGVGDPLYDLAVVAQSHNLSDSQVDAFIHFYCPGLDLVEAKVVIGVYKKCYGLREMVWMLLKHMVTPKDTFNLQAYYSFKSSSGLNPFYSFN